jgi:XTP/dITP diphosphohydrolase
MRILVATSNKGKLREIKRILEPMGFELLSPEHKLSVEEKGSTFLENAYLKAKAYYEEFGIPALGDDSGLVVEALRGYPGIYSSRFYSLELGGYEEPTPSESEANIRKLLRLLRGEPNRRAKFVACMLLYRGQDGVFAFGECKGEILDRKEGQGGFGYDPIFKPEGYDRSMAQLKSEEKDKISHRGKALRKLATILLKEG